MGRHAKLYTYQGSPVTLAALARMAGITTAAMHARINLYGYTVERAATTGPQRGGHARTPITFGDRTLTVGDWSKVVGIKPGTLKTRLVNGWSVEQALTIPTHEQRRRGVVNNLPGLSGTGGGSTLYPTINIDFPKSTEADHE